MLFEYFFVGLIIGFLFYELTDISPGGVIAPAYFALFIGQWQKIAITVLIALLVWQILKFLASRLIIYGRRRLVLAMILGFFIKVIIETWIQPIPEFKFDLQSIGYIIPGLIANELERQGSLKTLSAIGIVTIIIQLVILALRAI